jgi:hypothetical protein
MRTTDGMSAIGYAELVRRVVGWVAAQERYPTYRDISRRYKLTLDEVEDIIGDSEVYGPKLVTHAQERVRGNTTVEVLS